FVVVTTISNATVVDLALDIVEVDGEPRSKRGKLSGRKTVWACPDRHERGVIPVSDPLPICPACGRPGEALLRPIMRGGRRVHGPEAPATVRARALSEVSRVSDRAGQRDGGPY